MVNKMIRRAGRFRSGSGQADVSARQFGRTGRRVGNKLLNRATKVTNHADSEKQLALPDFLRAAVQANSS